MNYLFAPMEGVTGHTFRQLHRTFFPGVTQYYLPFISPTGDHRFTGRNLRELSPEHPDKALSVPQLLTNRPEDFLWAAENLADLGFSSVNLNVGCPSGTVVHKRKGAGMLADLGQLARFLDEIFSRCPLPISIKTRLGLTHPEEFIPLLALYNQYPLQLLIVHPRTREEMYGGSVHLDEFAYAAANCRCPLCYNGDLVTRQDFAAFSQRFPQQDTVMVGRGLVANPALCQRLAGAPLDKLRLHRFHNALCQAYLEAGGGQPVALARMKELWFYFSHNFVQPQSWQKQLRKARRWPEFYDLTQKIWEAIPLAQDASPFGSPPQAPAFPAG